MMSDFDECISSRYHKLEFAFLIQRLKYYLFIDEDRTVICSFRKYNRFNICIYHPFKRNLKTLQQNFAYKKPIGNQTLEENGINLSWIQSTEKENG